MGEKERFKILEEEKIDKSIYYYLKNLFNQLQIEILGRYNGNLFDLMKTGKLEGWCWQTTNSSALFMPDDDIVYRGNLYFNKYKTYYHSFLLFNYEGKQYVFDPCFCMVNSCNLYFSVFEIDIKGFATAKEIKEYFLKHINNPPRKKEYESEKIFKATDRFMRKFFGDDYLENIEQEIIIRGKEDPYAPMYRNGVGYKNIDIDNNKIKSLTAHYYLNC